MERAAYHVRTQGHVFTVISPAGTPLYSFADRAQAEAEAALLNEAERSRELTGADRPPKLSRRLSESTGQGIV